MTDRGLNDEIIAELAKQQITIAHLLSIGFAVPDYFADTRRNIIWEGNTFTGSGDWIRIPDIKETIMPALDSITLAISGVNQANISKVLNEDYTNVPVNIWRVLLDSDSQMISSPIEIFFGVIDNYTISEDADNGKSDIIWKVTSHWVDFERLSGRRTNNEDQQRHFPGDLGMEFAPKNVVDLKWGP